MVAVDLAEASLAVARGKDRAQNVTWRHGGASELPAVAADLAVMRGNVAQILVIDESWAEALEACAQRCSLGGHLVFETRRPECRPWEEWAAETAVTLNLPASGPVHRTLEVTTVRMPLVWFGTRIDS